MFEKFFETLKLSDIEAVGDEIQTFPTEYEALDRVKKHYVNIILNCSPCVGILPEIPKIVEDFDFEETFKELTLDSVPKELVDVIIRWFKETIDINEPSDEIPWIHNLLESKTITDSYLRSELVKFADSLEVNDRLKTYQDAHNKVLNDENFRDWLTEFVIEYMGSTVYLPKSRLVKLSKDVFERLNDKFKMYESFKEMILNKFGSR